MYEVTEEFSKRMVERLAQYSSKDRLAKEENDNKARDSYDEIKKRVLDLKPNIDLLLNLGSKCDQYGIDISKFMASEDGLDHRDEKDGLWNFGFVRKRDGKIEGIGNFPEDDDCLYVLADDQWVHMHRRYKIKTQPMVDKLDCTYKNYAYFVRRFEAFEAGFMEFLGELFKDYDI